MSSSSHSARSYKRLSLNLSNGPRQLHLVHANSPSNLESFTQFPEDSPKSPPPSNATNSFRSNPRRQSSISYLPRDRGSDRDAVVRSPLISPRYSSTNSVSGDSKPSNPLPTPRDRRSGAFDVNRPPLTHAEKHPELLHFIAQKEATCLELRSQLAVHEAELLELKRRWEGIISRGFEASTSDSMSSQGQGSGAMLEGIREGVQGVSRFLAAGLAIGELPPPLTSAPLRRTHSASQSSSSISTNTTKSTRFSQSSVSSIGEEPLMLNGPSLSKEHDTVQVLIVRDTGATPTMSPNPDFVHKQQQQEQQRAAALVESSPETEPDCFPSSSMRKSTKIHRRKSRDSSNSINLTLPLENLLTLPDSPSSSRSVSPSVDLKREITRAKKATMHGSSSPPVSSIPGLGSLTLSTTAPPVVSWVGSVGKKWEELQRGSTFSKSQKRASLLLSDMSQSIASAISISPPPLLSSASASSQPSTSASASTLSTPSTAPSYFSPLATSPITASMTSTSLLDNDDEDLISSSVMKPDLKPKPIPTMQPVRPSARPEIGTKTSGAQVKEPEEEWNW